MTPTHNVSDADRAAFDARMLEKPAATHPVIGTWAVYHKDHGFVCYVMTFSEATAEAYAIVDATTEEDRDGWEWVSADTEWLLVDDQKHIICAVRPTSLHDVIRRELSGHA